MNKQAKLLCMQTLITYLFSFKGICWERMHYARLHTNFKLIFNKGACYLQLLERWSPCAQGSQCVKPTISTRREPRLNTAKAHSKTESEMNGDRLVPLSSGSITDYQMEWKRYIQANPTLWLICSPKQCGHQHINRFRGITQVSQNWGLTKDVHNCLVSSIRALPSTRILSPYFVSK